MEGIFEWVKSIVFYLILLTVVMHLIPGKKYEKYIRLFSGMLLVMIVIKPVIQIFSWDEIYDKNFLEILEKSENYVMAEDDGQPDFLYVQEEQLLEEYEKQVEAFAATQASQLGFDVVKFRTKVEKQQEVLVPALIQMELTMSETGVAIDEIKVADIVAGESKISKTESIQAQQLQKVLAGYYGMEKDKVVIIVV